MDTGNLDLLASAAFRNAGAGTPRPSPEVKPQKKPSQTLPVMFLTERLAEIAAKSKR